jgi:AraC-like DNA-binding protein
LEERLSAAVWLRQVVQAISACGLDGPGLCRQAGLDPAALAQADARFPNDVIARLWELATLRSGNPAIGLEAARAVKPAAFDALGYAMMSSSDLHSALQRAVRYARIMSNSTTARLTHFDTGAQFEVITRRSVRPDPRQGTDFVMLSLLNFLGWLVARPLMPMQVEFAAAAPADARPYHDAFQCPVLFGRARDALTFSPTQLAWPLATSNPLLVELLDRHAEQRIDELEAAPIVPRVRRLMVQALPDGEPRRAAIAAALGLSERALRQRLRDEGTSFQALLEGTRRQSAERYLASEQIALAEAACLLGFADQAGFTRACRRWFEATPRQLRLRLRSA